MPLYFATCRRWYFLPDVFNIQTEQFGVAFALTVLGFMTGSLINARVVVRFGLDATLRTGLLISLLTAAIITILAPSAEQFLALMAGLSSLFFLGVGLTSANASMGAISLYTERAGAASAVYGSTHALLAAAIGAVAGTLYRGRLIEPAMITLICAIIAVGGFILSRGTAKQSAFLQ